MCGICGFFGNKKISHEALSIMNDTMKHRGPDDCGVEEIYLEEGLYAGLAHRRLSILDLSKLGHQPMHGTTDEIIVVFNGEIYNFYELKVDLSNYYKFKTTSDTEVIIASYLKWGIACINKFNGMFSIAILDKRINELFLIRDRIGQKPLYYFVENSIEGITITFSSELKGIMTTPGFVKKINRSIIPKYLFSQYISSPNTIFDGVKQIEPGSYLRATKNTYEIKRYWDTYEEYKKAQHRQINDFCEAKEIVKQSLICSVKRRLVSDVPVGTFLSGGIDSSIVSAIAQAQISSPLKTFCIGFSDPRYDESDKARRIAGFLGTDHTSIIISEKDMLSLVEDIPIYYDEPFADASEIPTMLVSSLAKQKVTVALSGDGGDELFCGYNRYDSIRIAQKYNLIGEILDKTGQIHFANHQINDLYPVKIKMLADNSVSQFKSQPADRFLESIVSNMLGEPVKPEMLLNNEDGIDITDWQVKRMIMDLCISLPNDILTKVDRASMKYSLETRCPFLDYEFIKTSFSVPQKYKYSRGMKKRILKEISYDYIPKELLQYPKQGFDVPIEKWLKDPLKERLRFYSSSSFLRKQGIFNVEYTTKFIRDYLDNEIKAYRSHRVYLIVWNFFVFQQWYNKWILS